MDKNFSRATFYKTSPTRTGLGLSPILKISFWLVKDYMTSQTLETLRTRPILSMKFMTAYVLYNKLLEATTQRYETAYASG